MSDTRTHTCGREMAPTAFGKQSPTANYRGQPIWVCTGPCNAWEPREGWQGVLPDGWDGNKWTEEN